MAARRRTWAAALLAVAVAGVGASGAAADGPRLPRGSEPVTLNPAEFTTRIDNPYWPKRPGGRWVYRETTPDGKVSVLTARCLGSCSLAPAMILDGEVQGKLTADAVVARLEAL